MLFLWKSLDALRPHEEHIVTLIYFPAMHTTHSSPFGSFVQQFDRWKITYDHAALAVLDSLLVHTTCSLLGAVTLSEMILLPLL